MVVLHRSPDYASYLPQILAREVRLHVKVPDEDEPLRPGVCLVGLPNRHLTVGPDLRVHFLQDHFYRGHNINVLFQSLAQHAGKRTIGVVLSGLLKDGTLGLKAIKEAGGVALVQSPEQAVYSEMPRNAIHHDGAIDFVGSLHALANEIRRLVDDVPAERL